VSLAGFPSEFAADEELDASGLLCPEPVMLLHQRINAMHGGQTLRIIATDPSTRRDFSRFCEFLNHDLVQEAELDGHFLFLVRKGG
jgi:tRNA 2-thiouridine synthesizing protein A